MILKLIAALLSLSIVVLDPPTPPRPAQSPHVREIHGLKIDDPYFWLREKTTPRCSNT
jgi:protease II